ncbi:hypothetical protein [Alteromonas macleodii]|nr:hypothetical protein [Alteromonas macleodii]
MAGDPREIAVENRDMYRGSCSCQAIQYEIDHIGELDADDETLSHSDTQ